MRSATLVRMRRHQTALTQNVARESWRACDVTLASILRTALDWYKLLTVNVGLVFLTVRTSHRLVHSTEDSVLLTKLVVAESWLLGFYVVVWCYKAMH